MFHLHRRGDTDERVRKGSPAKTLADPGEGLSGPESAAEALGSLSEGRPERVKGEGRYG